jgi:V/A-type H+/Na+-transporting ATPase subunit E
MAPLESVESLGTIVINESRDKAEWNVKSAQETSKKILDDAGGKAKDNYERIVQQGKQSGEKERQKILSTIEMEMKKLVLNSKEALIEQAFALAWKKFEEFKKSKDYKDNLIKQVILSIRELEGKGFIVDVHKGDSFKIGPETLKQIEKETGKKGLSIEVREVEGDLGGVIVHERDGKISVDNTFASILERKKNETRVKVSEILFE